MCFKKFVILFSVFIILLAALVPNLASVRAASTSPQAAHDRTINTNQLIIKYKTNTTANSSPARAEQMQGLSAAAGVALNYVRPMSGNAHVLRLPERMPDAQVQRIVDRLSALPEVEYALPDQIWVPFMTPNDTRYSEQWDLFGTWGIDAPAAWDITTGSASVVIADIDTGITNHSEFAERTVPGYDFISNAWTANDGQAADPGSDRDSDPSDPGDYIAAGACGNVYAENSTWHGTHTAGTIGATGNNGQGVAGINWNSKILPVRVMGRCGGDEADIIDAMRWSAGISVSGVPNNANPAKVLNLSLGGPSVCDAASQSAINDVVSAGSVVVVSAGNNNKDASGYSPANCNGVITVAATDKSGNRASYSNYGTSVEISAPGGAQSYDNDPNGILSTLNSGATSPSTENYIYYQGTSMAAPHVTGVISLMFSVNPDLTPAEVLSTIQSTAKAFPVGGSCTTSTCGSGIVDAAAAVNAVAMPAAFDKTGPGNGAANLATNPTLSWNTSAKATSYNYCYSTSSGCTPATPTTNTSVPLSGLNNFTKYYWQVQAVNSFGSTLANGGYWDFTTVQIPPAAFNKINPANTGTAPYNFSLNWQSSTGATSYTYCLDQTPGDTCDTGWGSTTNTSVSFTNKPLGVYYWQVQAHNAKGDVIANGGAWWSFTVVSTFNLYLPLVFKPVPPPGGFNKSAPANGAAGVALNPTLSWGTSTGATSFEYCYDVSTGCTNWTPNGTSTSKALTELTSNTTYYWQVRAVNDGGYTQADGGAYGSFTTIAPPAAFDKASPGNGENGVATNPILDWADSARATSYQYCYGTSTGCTNWTPNGMTSSKGLSGLAHDTTYYWQVRAAGDGGYTLANGGTYWSFRTLPLPTTIMSENFEGVFPGNQWQLYPTSGYIWGRRSCLPYSGSYSAWAVGGGSGASMLCGSTYPNNTETWMVYGPFSLVGATAADLTSQIWFNTQSGIDKVGVYASVNLTNGFYGYYYSGNRGSWITDSFDLSNVNTLGNLLGSPNVWIGIRFFSDGSTSYTAGAYVDNIVLRKCTVSACDFGTTSASSGGTMTRTLSSAVLPK